MYYSLILTRFNPTSTVEDSNKRQEIPKGQSTMDKPEKLPTQGIQDEDKQSKNAAQYVLNTTLRKQTQIT